MDNASKALIMAGAILIAVAIVGIGIYILTSTDLMTDGALNQVDALTVSAVNARFEVYLGEKVNVSQLENLVNTINAMNRDSDITRMVRLEDIEGSTFTEDNTNNIYTYTLSSDLKSNYKYTVYIKEYDSEGYVSIIAIDKND